MILGFFCGYLLVLILLLGICTVQKWTVMYVQRVHKFREHFKLFIAQEVQIIQTSYTCHFEEKL
jgi:hypothetical protein